MRWPKAKGIHRPPQPKSSEKSSETMVSNQLVQKTSMPTFSELIEKDKWLPAGQQADKLAGMIAETLYATPTEATFEGVQLTSIPVKAHMWDREEKRGPSACVRLQCTLTGELFWLSKEGTVPAVVFQWEGPGTWTDIVHPRLVDAGREEVMVALVGWLSREVLETSTRLEFLLRRARCLLKQETLPVEQDVLEDVDLLSRPTRRDR